MINPKFILVIFTIIGFISCDDKQVFDTYKTVSGAWKMDDKVNFMLPELDSITPYNLFINVRNTNAYQYSNLFLISEMKFPNGKIVTDTLEYDMAAPNGEWLGTGFTDLKESKLWYKEGVIFSEKGTYSITLQHAMRKNGEVEGIYALDGISDIGFRIEHAQKP